MTYEEREKMLCNDCEAKENCSYISRNLERKCSFRETVMYGWELGWKDATDKACEWLRRTQPQIIFPDTTIERFKKAMEEQQ